MFNKVPLIILVVITGFASQSVNGAGGKGALFLVRENGKVGYIDQRGQLAIPPSFDDGKEFSEGLAAVMIDSVWGYVDESGTVVVPPKFEFAHKFSEGLAAVMSADRLYGFIDQKGKFIVQPQYSVAFAFSDGLARVGIGPQPVDRPGWFCRHPQMPDKWLYLDHKGKAVIQPKFDYVDDFHEGLAVVARQNGSKTDVSYIDKEGKLAFDEWFVAASPFSEGVAVVSNDPNGFTSLAGNSVMFDNYNELPVANSEVQKHVGFVLIDSTGNKTPIGKFQNVSDFSDGLAAVQLTGKWGFINKQGQFVIKPKFDAVDDFSEGLANVIEGKKSFVVDTSGQSVFDVDFSILYLFRNGLAYVENCFHGPCEAGYVDKTGKVVWTPSR
jgi:hypothetical protein